MNAITRRVSLIAVVALSSITLAACGSGSDSAAPAPKKDLVIGQVTEPEKAPDPITDGSLAGYNYYYNTFDQLTALDPEGAVIPKLATEWTPSDDFKTWTYTIRSDVKFHDGTALTAKDVAFTYNKILDTPDSDNLFYMGQLESVKATDDTTVVFGLNAAFSPWPAITTAISIVPQAAYEKLGSEAFAKAPIGSGPFKFSSWTRGVSYVITANPSYWGAKPALDKVTFQTVADENARLNGVQSGSLDLALISPNQVDGLAGADAVKVASRVSNGVTFLGMNSTTGPLANVKIRQAISKAIDLDALSKNVLAGRATPNSQLAAPNVAGFDKGFANAPYDPAAAKALLAEAGYKGEAIPFEYATDGRIPLSSDIAQAIQGFLSAVGIKVQMIGMDQASLSDKIYGTVTIKGLYLNTWAPSTMDGDMPVTNLFAGGQNDYAKQAATKALVEEQRSFSGPERVAVFTKLNTLNQEQALILGLYTPNTDYAVNPDLNWTPRADGEFYLGDTSFT
jgi:peptide/nickel transport system substrate-binding protein